MSRLTTTVPQVEAMPSLLPVGGEGTLALAGHWRALQSQGARLRERDILAMTFTVAIVEPIQVRAVPLAALALVAAVLMPALPQLPLEGASGRILALQDLDGALIVALLGPPPPLQFGRDPGS